MIFKKNPLLVSSFTLLILLSFSLSAQEQRKSTFLGSSLIHMPSTEDVGKNGLDFRFNHRFGNAKSTSYDFFGLDNGANTQLSLDYGLTDRITIGIARTSFQKTYEARGKIRLLTQDSNFPVTISFLEFSVKKRKNNLNFTVLILKPPPVFRVLILN